ncbi:uncharacterized protein LOC107774133 isoform X3 [Nicotiana tabacum]|uniref:Uncharacterized protein LOC107774133 isoform X3 n=1 Tax=Nicotiana tabacum TaxID=4097 RepID=A0A1S3YA48_TOBAC|nr:PREDICTED: uncharacterized protein LOC107774133 isoform X3 [Nicotiana tabacum]
MEDGIDADVLMDYVEFQIFPSQNRYESHICYGNKLETLTSGLLEQLVLHSPKIKSLHSKGSDSNFRFRPLGNLSDAKWFTKSTLIRFLRIVSSSPTIDMAKAMVNEISQLEEARKFHVSLYSKGPQDRIGSDETAECDYSSGAVSSSQQADDNSSSSDASKNELLRAIELRLTALKGELAAAIDQAAGTTCSFEDVINIEKFSYYFGAVEMRNCLQKFIALSHEIPGKELSLSRTDVRNDKVGSVEGNSQTSGTSKSETPVTYSASPAKAAQMERQNSSGNEESSCTSEEEQPSAERSRTLIRSASPRRSASPMRRVQIGRSGSRRSTALTIKSLNYFPARERSISHKDAAASGSDEEDSEQTSKKAEKDVCRMSVQDAISLFENKQNGGTVDYQRTKSLLNGSIGANKAVLRRWSSGVCESSKGSVDVATDDPVSMAINKSEDQETEGTLEIKPDSYSPPKSLDADVTAADFEHNLPEEKAHSPKATREESLPNQGAEIGEKLNASVEWTRQKEAELNQLLTKMMETKPTKYRSSAATDSKHQSRPTERRGGFYDHYKEKRDEKLRGETARNRAEKDKQFKALQQVLDERKAAIVSGNASNVSKKPNIKRTQRTVKNSLESAKTKDETPKPTVVKKASSKASQLPATRKSWPSMPSPRVTGTSTAKTPKTPPITNSAGTTPTRRRSQPTTAVPQTSQKVEKLQPQAKPVKAPQNNIRKNVPNGDKKLQTLTKASKPTKAKVQPTSGDSASSTKPRLSKVTKKSSVVPVESKEAKPFLRKGSGTGSGHSPVIKAKVSSQSEKSLRESTDFVQVEENEMAYVASGPLNQLQDRGLEELKIHEDEDSGIQLNSPQKYEDRESCNKVTPDSEDDFRRMEESTLKSEVEEESNISPSAWVEIEEQEDQAISCNDGFGPNESQADVATVRISSPRVRHSLSQMLLEESSEDVIDWGNAENPPTMIYQKDVPKGLKRLLNFTRKSKTDSNPTGVSSPSFFSEGEDDPEDSKLLTKSSSDNLLKKATLHAKHSGQPKSSSEAYELSAQTSIGKIAAQKLQASRLSAPASTTKASRSFFSLSAFKGSK